MYYTVGKFEWEIVMLAHLEQFSGSLIFLQLPPINWNPCEQTQLFGSWRWSQSVGHRWLNLLNPIYPQTTSNIDCYWCNSRDDRSIQSKFLQNNYYVWGYQYIVNNFQYTHIGCKSEHFEQFAEQTRQVANSADNRMSHSAEQSLSASYASQGIRASGTN